MDIARSCCNRPQSIETANEGRKGWKISDRTPTARRGVLVVNFNHVSCLMRFHICIVHSTCCIPFLSIHICEGIAILTWSPRYRKIIQIYRMEPGPGQRNLWGPCDLPPFLKYHPCNLRPGQRRFPDKRYAADPRSLALACS